MGADYLDCWLWTAGPLNVQPGHEIIDAYELSAGVITNLTDLFCCDEDEPEIRRELHELLDSTETSLTARDVGSVDYGPVTAFTTGGMSWGDAPTDSYQLWSRWFEDELPDDLRNTVFKAVGIIEPLWSKDCPYVVVPRTATHLTPQEA